MDFLQDLLIIQHHETLKELSLQLLSDKFEQEQFINKFEKRNYCLIKVGNVTMKDKRDRVKTKDLLSTLSL